MVHSTLKRKLSTDNLLPPAAAVKQARLGSVRSSARAVVNRVLEPFRGGRQGEIKNAVWVCGAGDSYQLGLGPSDEAMAEVSRPKRHAIVADKLGDSSPIQVVAGALHSMLLDSEGRIWTWGVNDLGALGRPTAVPGASAAQREEAESFPSTVSLPDNFSPVRISAGDNLSMALSAEGRVVAWGAFRSNEGELGFSSVAVASSRIVKPQAQRPHHQAVFIDALAHVHVVQIAQGHNHALALSTTGRIYAWGQGPESQLGRRITPRQPSSRYFPEPLQLKNIVLIGTGGDHSFAVDKDGQVFAWGKNAMHQCGIDEGHYSADEPLVALPTPVHSLHPSNHGGAKVIQIASGEHHSVALFSNGEVWTCGQTNFSECGLTKDHPAMIRLNAWKKAELDRRADAIAAGTATKNVDEYIPTFQRVYFPQTPSPDNKNPTVPPISQPSDTKIVYIAAGVSNSLAISEAGFAYTWGSGETGQLGLGDEAQADEPTRMSGKDLTGMTVAAASLGSQHTIMLGHFRK